MDPRLYEKNVQKKLEAIYSPAKKVPVCDDPSRFFKLNAKASFKGLVPMFKNSLNNRQGIIHRN